MQKRIIINADDFGLCEGVNKAIAQSHIDGVLTSATIMANMPAAVEAVDIAKQLTTLGIGVHLNLTDGKPISDNPLVQCLIDSSGEFNLSLSKLSLLSAISHKVRIAVFTELAAQIQWVIDNGIKPTHLDSHKNFHCCPAIFPLICSLAVRFKIPAIRFVFEPKQVSKTPWPLPAEGAKKAARKLRTRARINRFQNSELFKTNALLGLSHIGKINVNFYRAVTLYSPSETVEVITHPGFLEGLDQNKTSLLHQRVVEFNALVDDRTKHYFRASAIKPVHYGQL